MSNVDSLRSTLKTNYYPRFNEYEIKTKRRVHI